MKLIFCLGLFLLTGCVSQIFKEPNPTFSNEVSLQAPDSPFYKLEKSIFPSWKNKSTGNVISILSDCSNQNLNLKQALQIISGSIDNAQIKEEKKMTVQNKSALFQKIEGEIDGSAILIHSLSFKNNNCYYVTSLSGSPEKLALDIKSWDLFNKNIQFKK